MREIIENSHDTATGPDKIHYQMLKQFPTSSLETLLNMCHDIWTTRIYYENWLLATVVPKAKPVKTIKRLEIIGQ